MKTMANNNYYTIISINTSNSGKWQPHELKEHGLGISSPSIDRAIQESYYYYYLSLGIGLPTSFQS